NGDGKQTRDFVFGPDVARANYLALERDFVGAVNIGTGIETDINQLYRLLAQAAGSRAAPVHMPPKPGEQKRSSADRTVARKGPGWEPKVDLKAGLQRTLEFFRAATSGKTV